MLKILIADDHRVLREGLKKIIEQFGDINVTAEAADGHEVLQKLRKQSMDVVVLDLSMPGLNGLEVLKQIHTKYPKIAVLVLSQHPENPYALRAFRAGAAGYISKEKASTELIAAIRKVARQGKWVSDQTAQLLALSVNRDPSLPLHESLSDREFEVLCLMGDGKTVSEVADELCLSAKTISTYRARILEKLSLTKTSELILYVIQHQLTPSRV